jgi:hypothetical protein
MHIGRVLVLLAGIASASTATGAVTDLDFDGVADNLDNCLEVPNAAQRDTDRDGIGNRCDFDLNNDCEIDGRDLAVVQRLLFLPGGPHAQDADFDGDRRVDFGELALVAQALGESPGATGGANACTCRSPAPRTGAPNAAFGGAELFLIGAFGGGVPDASDLSVFSDQGGGRYLSRVYARHGGRLEYRVGDPSLSLEYCGGGVGLYATSELARDACTGLPGTVELPGRGCYEFALRAPATGEPAARVALRVEERLGGREIEVDDVGGRYAFAGGAELLIPPGAVSAPVTLTISELPCAAADALFAGAALATHEHRCLGGIVGEPDGFSFERPVTVSLPVGPLEAGEIPLWVTSGAGSGDYRLVPGEIRLDGEAGVLTATLTHFSSAAATAAEDRGPEVTSTGSLPPCCSDRSLAGPEGCCCDTIRVQVAEGDVSGSGCDCQMVGQDIEVEFLACPGQPLQRVSEFHSSENCPKDFSATVTPSELTLWTCEDRRLKFALEGTNEDGSQCRLSMPVRPVVSGDRGVVALKDLGADTYQLTGQREGSVEIDFASLVMRDTRLKVRADVVELAGNWRATEAGSQTCTVAGESVRESDRGSGPVRLRVSNCSRLTISTPSFAGDTAFAGALEKTGKPSRPFTYSLTPNDPERTLDCVMFMQSNGRAISFGEPFCPEGGCQALSCRETMTITGRVGSAASARSDSDTEWDFRSSWLQRTEDDVVTMSARCRGSSETVLRRR